MPSCSPSIIGAYNAPRSLRAAQALVAKLHTSPAPIAAAVRRQIAQELHEFETVLQVTEQGDASAQWARTASDVRLAARLS